MWALQGMAVAQGQESPTASEEFKGCTGAHPLLCSRIGEVLAELVGVSLAGLHLLMEPLNPPEVPHTHR